MYNMAYRLWYGKQVSEMERFMTTHNRQLEDLTEQVKRLRSALAELDDIKKVGELREIRKDLKQLVEAKPQDKTSSGDVVKPRKRGKKHAAAWLANSIDDLLETQQQYESNHSQMSKMVYPSAPPVVAEGSDSEDDEPGEDSD
jgi:TolA-binding protein